MRVLGSEQSAQSAHGHDGATALELEAVTKEYATTTAVDSLSIRVAEGEFFTLVGPSGCGKTTTLRMIAGFESPTAGTVRFYGSNMAGVPPEDRNIGVVFQNYALFPHMTVGENIAYGLKFSPPPEGESKSQRVADLLELVDLPDFEDRDTDQLSGGQQQRVAIARALAPGPDMLLLDEPMSALDARLRENLRRQVKSIQSELGITTIYITHDQEEALAISDRVAVLHDGRLEQLGSPRAIYEYPETRFVAEFIGDNNIFQGTVTQQTADELAVDVHGRTFSIGADPDYSISIGDRVTFSVRPERLVVDGAQNRMAATVESVEFLGESVRMHLSWEAQRLILRTQTSPPDDLTVGFAPGDVHVIAAD